MTAANLIGLVVALVLAGYLFYALVRGENL
jgi:K+-transporting ATPase KdpF subunit